ncbi:7067_t:CDS:1, partial [Gigaspora margarita]
KQDDDRNFKEQITNKNQQISQLKDNQTNLRQSLNDLQEQNKELITEKGKLTQELQAKNN